MPSRSFQPPRPGGIAIIAPRRGQSFLLPTVHIGEVDRTAAVSPRTGYKVPRAAGGRPGGRAIEPAVAGKGAEQLATRIEQGNVGRAAALERNGNGSASGR